MTVIFRRCGEELGRYELCNEGGQLFRDMVFDKIDVSVYQNHLIECRECQKGLDLGDDDVELLRTSPHP